MGVHGIGISGPLAGFCEYMKPPTLIPPYSLFERELLTGRVVALLYLSPFILHDGALRQYRLCTPQPLRFSLCADVAL